MTASGGPQHSAAARPANVGELGGLLAQANEAGQAVGIAGGRSKLHWGGRPESVDLVVSTLGLRGFSEVDPDNLTLAAAAGVSIAEAAEQARAIGRLLPLDPGTPARATVGGVVATSDQGARGAGFGGVRDVVLGMKVVLADGTPVKFGGRTMKNVSGYDLTRLFVGSLGVLGVITEVTFRLLPQPASEAVMVLSLGSLEQAADLAGHVIRSPLCPQCLEVVSPGFADLAGPPLADLAAESPGYLFFVGFAGHRAAVARSLADVASRHRGGAGAGGTPVVWWDGEAEQVYVGLAGARAAMAAAGLSVAARASMPLSEVWKPAEGCAVFRIGAARGALDLFMSADGGPEALTADLARRSRQAIAAGGRLIITEGWTHLAAGFDPWGETGSSLPVIRALKERFDPRGVLNPGKLIGSM